MENNTKARLLYVLQLLEQYSDEEHPLTTADLLSMLMEKYGISTHRITLKTDIETLQAYGVDIEVINSSQNKYYISSRQFEIPELKLLIDAVESSKFITAAKSKELVEKLCTLTSESKRATLVRNVSCEGRIKPGNEKIYYIVDCINEAINQNKKISFYYFRYNVRKEKKLSQAELAKLVGVSRNTISSIETGQFNPTAKLALVLCIALDKKFEELFYFD